MTSLLTGLLLAGIVMLAGCTVSLSPSGSATTAPTSTTDETSDVSAGTPTASPSSPSTETEIVTSNTSTDTLTTSQTDRPTETTIASTTVRPTTSTTDTPTRTEAETSTTSVTTQELTTSTPAPSETPGESVGLPRSCDARAIDTDHVETVYTDNETDIVKYNVTNENGYAVEVVVEIFSVSKDYPTNHPVIVPAGETVERTANVDVGTVGDYTYVGWDTCTPVENAGPAGKV